MGSPGRARLWTAIGHSAVTRSGPATLTNMAFGLLAGLIHWAIAGILLPMMDGMNSCVRSGKLEGFGAFGAKRGGMMIAGFLMGHLLYGLIVGWLYTVPATI
jgi:hypothetical protein